MGTRSHVEQCLKTRSAISIERVQNKGRVICGKSKRGKDLAQITSVLTFALFKKRFGVLVERF